MNNSESARKLNQAVNNTSRAVGGAISQAKEAFSSFWSTFSAPNVTAAPAEKVEVKATDFVVENAPKEVTEPREGVIKQIAKKLHGTTDTASLKQDKDTGSNNQGGIVEIGREANTLDSNRVDGVIDL